MRCQNCNFMVDECDIFCHNCGTRIEKKQEHKQNIRREKTGFWSRGCLKWINIIILIILSPFLIFIIWDCISLIFFPVIVYFLFS